MSIRFAQIDPDNGTSSEPGEFRPGRLISARSRINEYGGGSFWRALAGTSGPDEQLTFWVDAETQCIHSAHDEGALMVLTPRPPAVRSWRYSAGVLVPGLDWMIAERETHPQTDPSGHDRCDRGCSEHIEAINDIVAVQVGGMNVVPLIGPGQVGGGDFVAAPKVSPDGSALAWLRWDHPDMPWDAAELWVSPLEVVDGAPALSAPRRVAGGHDDSRSKDLGRPVSVCLPEWSPDGTLWWCDDADDWWHLRALPGPGVPDRAVGEACSRPIDGSDEEVGEPRWVSGGCRYGFTPSGQIVFVASSGGLDGLWTFDPRSGERSAVPGPGFTYIESICVHGDRVAVVGGTPARPTSVWLVDLTSGSSADVRNAQPGFGDEWISQPEPISFDTSDGERSFALLYRPTGDAEPTPDDELPPLVVRIHGGPTAAARSEFSPSVQFWTTRGFAVVDVNYRGSTGFGRIYRDKLRSKWGIADVQDCIAVAKYLSVAGIVDPARCVIRGGSSGGFTALAALCFQAEWGNPGALAAACSLYGVTDLAALARDTHKFESRYLDGLVGHYPEESDRYSERSPLYNADKLDRPVLLLQGSEDRIVPQSQAEVLIDALDNNDVPHAYMLFEGEGHGFVNSESISRALEAELAFYGMVLGFTPADRLPPISFR